jgi:hypothetical protein
MEMIAGVESCLNVARPRWVSHHRVKVDHALEAIREAEALAERFEGRWWSGELHRLRGVFFAALGADETQIEASFRQAIRVAKEQKSISLEKRAEATYAEYRRQKTMQFVSIPLVGTADLLGGWSDPRAQRFQGRAEDHGPTNVTPT